MRFGLEVEKFLFDIKHHKPSDGVFRFIDALSDFESDCHITNEFVLNMVEIVTEPSDQTMEVLGDYIRNYLMFSSIAGRESVAMVGMGSLPMDYQPHMTPKWPYLIQNSILEKKLDKSFVMTKNSPLTPAGNCAGIHVHTEIETQPEYLFSTRELQDKFNMGLMLTPMIAFASSPYFFEEHEAVSMRGQRYFNGVYHNFPLNGGLPHVMESSEEVLKFFQYSASHWLKAGTSIGIPEDDLKRLIRKKGASWNPIRWNRVWNTIELRCLDSDRIDFDCAKFIWVTGAMKRMDLQGEALICEPLKGRELNQKMVDQAFEVKDGKVSILTSLGIKELFQLAIKSGINHPLVETYLYRLSEFSQIGVSAETMPIFDILQKVLETKETSSRLALEHFGHGSKIDKRQAISLVNFSIENEKRVLKNFISHFPEVNRWRGANRSII
jgi:gamma-glutamyl:cysteine ligase YbdK (ATP-grasp superfamily)